MIGCFEIKRELCLVVQNVFDALMTAMTDAKPSSNTLLLSWFSAIDVLTHRNTQAKIDAAEAEEEATIPSAPDGASDSKQGTCAGSAPPSPVADSDDDLCGMDFFDVENSADADPTPPCEIQAAAALPAATLPTPSTSPDGIAGLLESHEQVDVPLSDAAAPATAAAAVAFPAVERQARFRVVDGSVAAADGQGFERFSASGGMDAQKLLTVS